MKRQGGGLADGESQDFSNRNGTSSNEYGNFSNASKRDQD